VAEPRDRQQAPTHHVEHPTSPHEHGHSIYEPGEFLDAPASEPIPEREVSLARRFLNIRTIGSIVFGVALLVLLFVFVLGVDWGHTWSQIVHANLGLLLLALAVYYLTFPLRGFRWAFFEVADVNVAVSLAMTALFLGACLSAVWWIFKTGYRLKS